MAELNPDFPSLIVMAALALLPLLGLMHVVLLVAGKAVGLQLFLVHITLVAGDTFDLLVFVAQLELGLVVVEGGPYPRIHVVARLALETVLAFMFVVLLMTGITGRLQFLRKRAVLVTTGALDALMSAEQFEVRVLVVVELCLLPFAGVVTFIAFLPEGAPVHVVDLVARITIGRSLLEMLIGMADLAIHFFVLPGQRKLGLVVIELLAFP